MSMLVSELPLFDRPVSGLRESKAGEQTCIWSQSWSDPLLSGEPSPHLHEARTEGSESENFK